MSYVQGGYGVTPGGTEGLRVHNDLRISLLLFSFFRLPSSKERVEYQRPVSWDDPHPPSPSVLPVTRPSKTPVVLSSSFRLKSGGPPSSRSGSGNQERRGRTGLEP